MRHFRLFVSVIIVFCITTITYAQEPTNVSPDDIPESVPLVDEGEYHIINFLLLGSDTSVSTNSGRTDVLMIVSVNQTAGTVSILSLPRDLYVYIPGQRVYRINSAYGYGELAEQGSGAQLLIDTIRYNLGIEIDYWARVNFEGFKEIINNLGGLTVAVDCAIQDWRLIDPELDPNVEENWEMYTLPVGLHTMDGDLALWYVRSRRTSSDFDRGRRQQAVLRATWRRIRELNLFEQLTDVWGQVLETVQTNIPFDVMAGLLPLATSINTSQIASYTFRPNIEVRSWMSPEGSSVQAPNYEAIAQLIRNMYTPPTESQLVQEGARVEIINATGIAGMDRVAADRLAWEGFVPVLGSPAAQYQGQTALYDFTGQTKGSSLGEIQTALRIQDSAVIIEPDANRDVDFRVVIGGSYYSCTYAVQPPSTPEPVANPEGGEG